MISRYQEFSSGYFDVVVADECHRSIYGAWQTALTHFDAIHVGLTATPADYIERNTFQFYQCQEGEPDCSYSILDAFREGYLVPYKFATGITVLLTEGAEVDEEHYDPVEFERKWTNEDTNRKMMEEFDRLAWGSYQELAPGQRVGPGKSIVFAITKHHASRLARYLNELHPECRGRYAEMITSDIPDADRVIRRFNNEDYPQVAVSVGMLDTGFNCREVLHLVMCRRVRSPILYQQMRGRGTRTAPHIGKQKFVIYDFFGNHDYFNDSDTDIFVGTALRDFVRDKVFPYMDSLVAREPQVAEYFRDAVLEITDPNVLKQVVDELDAINFQKMGTDVKGDIFEYLLTHLGQAALNGQFRTPRQIRTMMVELADPDLGDTIYDPACGTGGFLIDTVEHILAKYSDAPREVPIYGEEWLEKRGQTIEEAKAAIPTFQTYRQGDGEKLPDWGLLGSSIYGNDVSRQLMRITMMNLVLHGISNASVKRANTLSEQGELTDEDKQRKYRVILSNPPFAGVLPEGSIRKDLPTRSKKSELLFLGAIMQSLAPGGRCAVVVPEGLLFGSTRAHQDLRRKLVEEYELQAVVSLPARVFKPYSGVKTGVLVFRRPPENTPEGSKAGPVGARHASPLRRRVWFYEVHTDGFDPDRIVGGGRPETPERNDIPDLVANWRAYKQSGFREPPGVEAGTLLEPGSDGPRCWWATLETITENDYNLAAGRYKPQVAEQAPTEDPAELIREVLAIEQEIAAGLDKLLQDVGAVR